MSTKRSKKRQQEAAEARQAVATIQERLAVLDTLTVAQLREEYQRVFGEPTRSQNKAHIKKKIAWKIQEQAEGGLSERALDRIEELAADAPARWRQPSQKSNGKPGNGQTAHAIPVVAAPTVEAAPSPSSPTPTSTKPRDPRLPEPGTVIHKEHKGVVHEITVLEDGFEYAGQRYRSLSAIAKVVTGTTWNGYLWAGLTTRKPKPISTPGANSTEKGEDGK